MKKSPIVSTLTLLVGLVIGSTIAYLVPNSVLWAKPHLSTLVAITMLAVGTLITKNEIDEVIKRWHTVFGGTALQYTTMPLLAYGIGTLCGLEGDALAGVMIVGCVPGAMASNVLTLAARGNTTYSVSLTTSATLLSPIFVPLALKWTLGVSTQSVSLFLLLVVVVPVIVGHTIRRLWKAGDQTFQRFSPYVANLAILLIIAVVVAANQRNLALSSFAIVIPLVLINLGGYLAGYFGGMLIRIPEGMRRALTLEIGMQNAGLGAAMVSELKFGDEVTIAPAIYTFGCMLTGTMLACVWSLRPPTENGSSNSDSAPTASS